MSFKRILVAVDDSDSAKLALEKAVIMAKSFQSLLHIVHVEDEYAIHFVPEAPIEFKQTAIEEIRKSSHLLLKKMKEKAIDCGVVNVETQLIEIEWQKKHISEAIAEEAERSLPDLIVIGTHGRRGLSRFFMGSVAENLGRIASAPVLLVRADSK